MLMQTTVGAGLKTTTHTTGMFSLASLMTYLGISYESFLIFGILLIIDVTTGILRCLSLKNAITSAKLKYGILSKLMLLMIPIIIALGGIATRIDMGGLVDIVLNMLVLSEVYSIMGNIYTLRTGKFLPEYDVLRIIARRIKNILINLDEDIYDIETKNKTKTGKSKKKTRSNS